VYKDIILETIDSEGRFFVEAPSSLWDRNDLSQPTPPKP